jgi:hypothetical protein
MKRFGVNQSRDGPFNESGEVSSSRALGDSIFPNIRTMQRNPGLRGYVLP